MKSGLIFLLTAIRGSFCEVACNKEYVIKQIKTNIENSIPNCSSGVSVSRIETSTKDKKMTVPEIINKVIETPEFCFSIKNTRYVLYPREKLVEKLKHGERCLGYFHRFYTEGNSVYFEYKKGEKAANMKKYSSIVEFVPSKKNFATRSYRKRFGELSFVLNSDTFFSKSEVVTLGIERTGSDLPTCIGELLATSEVSDTEFKVLEKLDDICFMKKILKITENTSDAPLTGVSTPNEEETTEKKDIL